MFMGYFVCHQTRKRRFPAAASDFSFSVKIRALHVRLLWQQRKNRITAFYARKLSQPAHDAQRGLE
jgi:hypothetical protein